VQINASAQPAPGGQAQPDTGCTPICMHAE